MMQSIAIILICIIVKLYDCSAVAVTADDTDNDDHHNHQHDSRRTEWPMPAVVGAASFVHDQRTSVNTQMLDESSQPNKHDKTVMNQITTLNNVNDSGNRIHYNQPSDGNVDNNFDVTQWRSIGANRIRRENDRRQDICDTICVCRNEENFLTVECNFQQVSPTTPIPTLRPTEQRNYFRCFFALACVSHWGMCAGADASCLYVAFFSASLKIKYKTNANRRPRGDYSIGIK